MMNTKIITNIAFNEFYDSYPNGEPSYQETFEAGQAAANKQLIEALSVLESAVDWYLGRSAFTQTTHLKGLGHSNLVRKKLFDAHDKARIAIAAANKKQEAQ